VVALSSTPEGRRRRSDAERNLRAIVDAAAQVLAARPRASMQEIAAAAGLHRATVHRHFATRDELVEAVREHALDEFAAVIGDPALQELEPTEALEELTRRSLELGDRNRIYRVAATFDEASDARAELFARPVVEIVDRGQRAGVVRADLSPELLARAWGGLLLVTLPEIAAGETVDEAVRFVLALLVTPAAEPARG
jgi:TetR/AcrR family transcriptional regulator, mexCD-oprJ operon repressor